MPTTMAPIRSEKALERLLESGGFATDFTIVTQTKTFAVHQSVIDRVLPDNNLDSMALGNDELVLGVTAEVAEDFIRHSYGLQVPCLRRVAGLKPTVEQCLRVLDLSQQAAVIVITGYKRSFNLPQTIPSYWVAIGENLPYSSIMMDEMTGVYEELLKKLADSMQTILTGRKDLLERIVRCEELHCGVLRTLATRSETLKEIQTAKNDEVLPLKLISNSMAALIAQNILKSIWAQQSSEWPTDLDIICANKRGIKVHRLIVCNGSDHIARVCSETKQEDPILKINVPEPVAIVRSICGFMYGHDFSHDFDGRGDSIVDEFVCFLVAAEKYGVPTLRQQITESIIRRIESMRGDQLCWFGVTLLRRNKEHAAPPAEFEPVMRCALETFKVKLAEDESARWLQYNPEFLQELFALGGRNAEH
ncbi:hypothetical protein CBER1_03245 [Cercospora berteroae]|uniref:BTB domain-containing protein n=1 Tax=Cercospora berteroae TaxID=357750 RepID=A0A2S6C286_9PEZI|nr:hypothetical protein CBER1_03245 [Cercospora berteroae]